MEGPCLVFREDLAEKLTFGQRREESEGMSHTGSVEGCSRQSSEE